MSEPKILFYDIETACLELTAWGIYQQFIGHHQIKRDWNMLSAAWCWLKGAPQAASVKPTSPTDDRELVTKLRDVVASADIVVGHNSDAFDTRKLNARLAFHGLRPLPPLQSVDTKKLAKRVFGFTSNRLDYIGKHLGVGRKIKTDYDLWLQVLDGDPKALARMVRYNKGDVLLLRDVYLKLRPFDDHHPNYNLWKAASCCPRCGSTSFQKRGTQRSRTRTYERHQCTACGGWFRSVRSTSSVRFA